MAGNNPGIGARQREFIGVADTCSFDLDQHFTIAGALELHGRYFQRLTCGNGNGGADVHG
jgi:hypothetical protein